MTFTMFIKSGVFLGGVLAENDDLSFKSARFAKYHAD